MPVDVKDKEEQTPLHTASQYGHIEIIKMLVQKFRADTNIVNKNGDTAVGIAQRNKHNDIITWLEDWDGLTPLHTAIRCKDSQSVERLAKERKDKIDQPTKFGCTALHYASRQGNAEIVKILMENGANVDIERADRWTALQSASSLGYT